jgi:hypothetical protein
MVVVTLWICGLLTAPQFAAERELLERAANIYKYHFNEKQDQHCWDELAKVARRYRYPVNMAGNFIDQVDGLFAAIDEAEIAHNRRIGRRQLTKLETDLQEVTGLAETMHDVREAHTIQLGASDDDCFDRRVIAWCERYDVPHMGNDKILELLNEVQTEIEERMKALTEPETAPVTVVV